MIIYYCHTVSLLQPALVPSEVRSQLVQSVAILRQLALGIEAAIRRSRVVNVCGEKYL